MYVCAMAKENYLLREKCEGRVIWDVKIQVYSNIEVVTNIYIYIYGRK